MPFLTDLLFVNALAQKRMQERELSTRALEGIQGPLLPFVLDASASCSMPDNLSQGGGAQAGALY